MNFEPSEFLAKNWHKLNRLVFGSMLKPPQNIGWVSSDPELPDIYGGYASRANEIGISNELRRAEEIDKKLAAQKTDQPMNDPNLDEVSDEDLDVVTAALGLLAHEMAHQATHQLSQNSAASHGEEFVRNAGLLAEPLGLPLPTVTNAPSWPGVLPVIVRERARLGGTGA